MNNKLVLESLIRQKKTIGNYVFDEAEKCFFGDIEIELYISKVDENIFKSELYFFDTYEITLEENKKEYYNASEEQANKMVIESFNAQPELFMGYPIFYIKDPCQLYE